MKMNPRAPSVKSDGVKAASLGHATEGMRGDFKTAFSAVALVGLGALLTATVLCVAAEAIAYALISASNGGNGKTAAAALVFVVTYVIIAIGKLPGYQLDRARAALLGASLMVGLGVRAAR